MGINTNDDALSGQASYVPALPTCNRRSLHSSVHFSSPWTMQCSSPPPLSSSHFQKGNISSHFQKGNHSCFVQIPNTIVCNFLLCTKMHHLDMILFRSNINHSYSPSGICLSGTQLLQSPFRTEFSMGSRLRRYRRSLRRHRRFLRSYRRSLRRCRDPWGNRRPRGRRRDSLNNIASRNICCCATR